MTYLPCPAPVAPIIICLGNTFGCGLRSPPPLTVMRGCVVRCYRSALPGYDTPCTRYMSKT